MRATIGFVLLLLTACASGQAATDAHLDIGGVNVTAAEAESIRAQIEPNFGKPIHADCRTKISVRAVLAPDGTVQRMELLQKFAPEDPCSAAQQAATRAIAASSPLHLPKGKSWPSIVLNFDPDRPRTY